MTKKNKAIFKEFLRLKWGEVKYLFKVIIPIILLIIFLVGGLMALGYFCIPLLFGINKIYGLLFASCVGVVLCIIALWFDSNWNEAKENIEKKT